ncbi:MAG: hypothetical protein IKX79_01415, partial [Desulfovibrionaceae bacterium]|nr:hypothetical protein [Desulfovibrionaceae bacterium]
SLGFFLREKNIDANLPPFNFWQGYGKSAMRARIGLRGLPCEQCSKPDMACLAATETNHASSKKNI